MSPSPTGSLHPARCFDHLVGAAASAPDESSGNACVDPGRHSRDPLQGGENLDGFRSVGVADVVGKIIPGGHFSPDEAPQCLADALREFGKTCRS
jgi:hypothetical protein